MKTKRDQYKKERGRILPALLAFVLAVGLALAAPSLDGPALAADPAGGQDAGAPQQDGGQDTAPTEPQDTQTPGAGQTAVPSATLDLEALKGNCSLTLEFPATGENVMGTNGAKLVNPDENLVAVDVYKIADAVMVPGYQTYQFSVSRQTDPALYDAIDKLIPTDTKTGWHRGGDAGSTITFYYAPDPKAAEDVRGWSEFVDALARVCLLNRNNIALAKRDQVFGQPITGLDPGLYLTVVHGAIPADGILTDDGDQYKDEGAAPAFAYPQYITAQSIRGANQRLEREIDGTIRTNLAGTAYDEQYIYLFQPQLVSLPGYTVDEQVPEAVPNNTAANGVWQPNVTMVTKHGAEPRYVDLQIVKQLPKYLAGEGGVTFVYQIDYTDEKGAPRTMTEAISFDGPSKDGKETRIIVDRIPLTSSITVTEIYAGYTYQFENAFAAINRNTACTAPGAGRTLNIWPTEGTASITIPADQLQPGSIQLTVPDAPAQNAQNPTAHTVRLDEGFTHIVTFSNTLTETNKGGGSVVNSFAGNAAGGWTWTKRAYNPITGKWEDVTDENGWKQPVETLPHAGGN